MCEIRYAFTDEKFGRKDGGYNLLNNVYPYSTYYQVLGSCGAMIYTEKIGRKHFPYQIDNLGVGVDIALNEDLPKLNAANLGTHIEYVSLALGEDTLNLALWIPDDPTTPVFSPSPGQF
jgi:hypothetical protein